MLRLLGLDHVVLRVKDVQSMTHFYCEVLGCAVERVREDLGLTQLRAGRSLIDLVTFDGELGRRGGSAPGAEGRNMDHLCLRIERFQTEELLPYLASRGVETGEVTTRYGAEGLGPSVYIRDPEGNTVELKGPPSSV